MKVTATFTLGDARDVDNNDTTERAAVEFLLARWLRDMTDCWLEVDNGQGEVLGSFSIESIDSITVE